jgi:hypothetical protein
MDSFDWIEVLGPYYSSRDCFSAIVLLFFATKEVFLSRFYASRVIAVVLRSIMNSSLIWMFLLLLHVASRCREKRKSHSSIAVVCVVLVKETTRLGDCRYLKNPFIHDIAAPSLEVLSAANENTPSPTNRSIRPK